LRATIKQKKAMKKYYQINKAKISIQRKKKYIINRTKILADKKIYSEQNREKISGKAKKRYKKNRKKILNGAIKKYWKDPAAARNAKRKSRKTKAGRDYYLQYEYGINSEFWENLFNEQGRKCGICKRKRPVGVGWMTDHKGKKVRGVLCRHCNLFIGLAKDSISILESAIAYLKRNENVK
jgi:hypothetical protein